MSLWLRRTVQFERLKIQWPVGISHKNYVLSLITWLSMIKFTDLEYEQVPMFEIHHISFSYHIECIFFPKSDDRQHLKGYSGFRIVF